MGSRQDADKFAVNVIHVFFFVINPTAPLPERLSVIVTRKPYKYSQASPNIYLDSTYSDQ